MEATLEKIKQACQERGVNITAMLREANIQTGDFYQAMNGKRSMFPAWKKRIAQCLRYQESELFAAEKKGE